MRRQLIAGFLSGVLLLIATGCWDQVQIEERGFIIGAAIDFPRSKQGEEQAKEEAPDKPRGKQRLLVTHQFVIPGGLAGGGNTGGGNQSSNEAFFNLSSEGESLFEISRQMAARTSRSPFYQHLKIVIVSEEIAKTEFGFSYVLDYFLRDPDLRRSSKVLVSKGEAKRVIEVTPKNEKLPVMYIDSVTENIEKNARMLPEMQVGDVHEQWVNQVSFVVPRVTAEQNEVKVAGSAVFQARNRMVGYLGEEETEGLNFLTEKIEGGVLKIKMQDNLVIFNIQGAKRSIKADIRDKEHIKFLFQIKCEGVIAESFERLDLFDKGTLVKLQKAVGKEIERMTGDTIRKVHKQMGADVLGLGSYLKQKHPQLWKQIKNNWERGQKLYGKSSIQVKTQVFIRNVGELNTTGTQ